MTTGPDRRYDLHATIINEQQFQEWLIKRDTPKKAIRDFWLAGSDSFHRIGWKFLHLTRLAKPWATLMCKLGLYAKYSDGRCKWCGK